MVDFVSATGVPRCRARLLSVMKWKAPIFFEFGTNYFIRTCARECAEGILNRTGLDGLDRGCSRWTAC